MIPVLEMNPLYVLFELANFFLAIMLLSKRKILLLTIIIVLSTLYLYRNEIRTTLQTKYEKIMNRMKTLFFGSTNEDDEEEGIETTSSSDRHLSSRILKQNRSESEAEIV